MINSKAYNDMDYGNRLWGKTAGTIGIPLWEAKLGAQINIRITDPKHGPDDPADKRAIQDGHNSVKRK